MPNRRESKAGRVAPATARDGLCAQILPSGRLFSILLFSSRPSPPPPPSLVKFAEFIHVDILVGVIFILFEMQVGLHFCCCRWREGVCGLGFCVCVRVCYLCFVVVVRQCEKSCIARWKNMLDYDVVLGVTIRTETGMTIIIIGVDSLCLTFL